MKIRRNKHGNVKVTHTDGQKFDSKRELARWIELCLLEKAGKISELARQYPFKLIPSVQLDGRKKPDVRYVADFIYRVKVEKGFIDKLVVEDSKAPHLRKDKTYRLKKHLMKHIYDIDIQEV